MSIARYPHLASEQANISFLYWVNKSDWDHPDRAAYTQWLKLRYGKRLFMEWCNGLQLIPGVPKEEENSMYMMYYISKGLFYSLNNITMSRHKKWALAWNNTAGKQAAADIE